VADYNTYVAKWALQPMSVTLAGTISRPLLSSTCAIFVTEASLRTNIPSKECSRQAEKWTRVSPWTLAYLHRACMFKVGRCRLTVSNPHFLS